MSVVLTGDVHQWISSADRRFAEESEAALAVTYARIAAEHGLKTTLFVTGRAVVGDTADLRPLLELESVEIGGHGWDAFRPAWRYRKVERLFGSAHGPAVLQARMVRRTCEALERFSGGPVRSWRNHAYVRDENTPLALARAGIVSWSDEVRADRTHPYRHASGLVVLPINTTPDHEHLYHGEQTVASVAPAQRPRYLHPGEWCERVCEQVERILEGGGVATILAHPLCMNVADGWRTFRRLCAAISRYSSAWASEATDHVIEERSADAQHR